MINAIYGKKIGMTRSSAEDDRVVPVTVIQAEPNTICQVKAKDSDGCEAVQLEASAPSRRKKVNISPWRSLRQAGHGSYALPARGARQENAGSTRWATSGRWPPSLGLPKKVDVTARSRAKTSPAS